MNTPVYFSKIQFNEYAYTKNLKECFDFARKNTILINIPMKELSYQVFSKNPKPASLIGTKSYMEYDGIPPMTYDYNEPMYYIKNGKTGFKRIPILDEQYEEDLIFEYALKLTDEQIEELLPYCNALDFEPYRGRKQSMDDPGFCGYRDEITCVFRGITDSYIPLIELPMDFIYDSKHEWPSERLYEYIVEK